MSFTSAAFWLFCLVVVAAHAAAPPRFRWPILLTASYVFYGSFGLGILAVLVGLTAVVFVASRAMAGADGRLRRVLLIAALAVPLAALVVFKYLSLFRDTILYLAGRLPAAAEPFNLLVPIGISFYVFKLISYSLDVYHRRTPAETHPGHFALYVAYFPQILAGPIERAGHLLPQVRDARRADAAGVLAGVRLVAWGLFKKLVVANRLALYVGEVFAAPEYKSLHLVFAAGLYYIQIYCDFSGYSDVSTGISRALGFTPPLNFNFPYLARDVSQFWTRWHITLSTWLRDYLFLPVAYAVMRRVPGDRRLGITTEAWGYTVGMLVTMALGGLWHGAAWTFVAWGAVHGVYLVASFATRRLRRRVARVAGLTARPRLHHALSILVTFSLVSFAWIPFRAESFDHVRRYVRYMQLKLPMEGVANLVFDLTLVAVFLGLEFLQRHADRFPVVARAPWPLKAAGYALFAVLLIVLAIDTSSPFIYFRF